MQYSRGSKSKRRSILGSSKPKRKYSRQQKNRSVLPKGYIKMIFTFGVIGIILWQVSGLFSGIWTKDGSAQLFIERGRAEFSLEGSSDWTRAITEQKFLPGDIIKTSNNTIASLRFFDGYELFLSENTELSIEKLSTSSSENKTMVFDIKQGQIWVHVPADKKIEAGDSNFLIQTPKTTIRAKGSIFDLVSNDNENIIRLVRGTVDAEIFMDEDKKDTNTVTIGVGQKLVINKQNIAVIANDGAALEMTDNNFLESDWHLTHLEKFSPEEATQIRRKLEIEAASKRKSAVQTAEENLPKADIETPQIITPANNTVVAASQDSIQIEGSAPAEAFQISVNGYTLTKFNPGDRKWSYFASKKFGTLVTGENTYEVVAITRDGKKSAPATIKLIYEGVNTGASTKEDPVVLAFPKPVITKPALTSLDAVYQTSSEVVTIIGTVPPGTQWVTVNDFRLRKFAPGNTKFSYIANARYGNMKRGDNNYRVSAFGPDGAQSTVTVKVYYQPLDL